MKKTLFSLAFVAVSGAYVAAANHLIGTPAEESVATAATAAPAPRSPVAPAAAVEPLAPLPPPPSLPPAPIVAEAAPTAPAVTAVAPPRAPLPSTAPTVAEIAPVEPPPMPRPRPTPPPTTLQPAASTDTAQAASGGYRDGTYTGTSENAYYGRVQVQVTIASHHVASVNVLDYPKDRRTSRYINSEALPLLKQEVISASSANVDTVSGATLTSEAFLRSLGKALSQAGGSSA